MDFKSQLNGLPLKIGAKLNVASNTFLWLKLFLIYPILLWQLEDKTHPHPAIVGFLLLLAMLFDYFRKVRYFYLLKENEPSIKQMNQKYFAHLDRLGDLPLNLWLLYSLYSQQILSPVLLLGKLLIDLLTLGFVFMDRGPKRLKLFNYIHLMSLWTMLLFNQKWLKGLFNHEVLMVILLIHISLFALVFLFQIRLLQKRFIADTLSAINLLCGVASMHASAQGKFGSALLYLLLGAAFDGFDGAAARKFGGTKFGVYSDDIADGVNYGIAPGVALSYLYQGYEGVVLGSIYSTFVLSRLVFFTLNKKSSDPNFFAGIPSPVGGMIVMSSIVLFTNMSTWVGFMVGVACALMVSFSTHYRHMGRALSKDKRALIGAPLYFLVFLLGGLIWGVKGSAATILFGSICYGFMPSAVHFISVFRSFFWGDAVEGVVEGVEGVEGVEDDVGEGAGEIKVKEEGDDDVIDGV
jgi:CDP-diacylglycerol--serine O-phosphatidyltransferase